MMAVEGAEQVPIFVPSFEVPRPLLLAKRFH